MVDLSRVYRMAGGVRRAMKPSPLVKRHLNFTGGILGFIQHFMTGIFIIKDNVVQKVRAKSSASFARAGIVQIRPRNGLRRAASTAGTSRSSGSRRLTAASEFRREVIIDAVKRIPAQPAHQ